VQLEIEYSDGAREVVGTDSSWKVTDRGPIREADLLMGESHDARQELSGWSKPGFDDTAWEASVPAAENPPLRATFHDGGGQREVELGFVAPARLQAYPAPPVRVTQTLKPVGITSPEKGVYIVNLGQNFAGNIRLRMKGVAGQQVRLRYGEMLHPDGRLMTENLRKARATDTYTMRGDPKGEEWAPRFTFHGFQYVEITGLKARPEARSVTGLVLHSDTPLISAFECSDPMVNQLFRNIVWTQRANFLELPTDCPQRDEREGWMGDAQLYARTATLNADVASFFNKWLQEVEEAQLPSGAYPDYCPWPFQHGKAFATAWTDAGIIVPWTIWKAYGDRLLIERLWPSMTRFMEWRRRQAKGFLGVEHPEGNKWGDWLNQNEATPIDYIDTVYWAYTARLMAEMAVALDKPKEVAAYRELFANIRSAFLGAYVKPDGTLTVESQTAHALALFAGLIPEAQRAAVAGRLAQKVRGNEFRMATGFLGTRPILPVLSANGQHDVAVRLLQSRRFPSWGFEVENGATTIWERWDSFTRENGFGGKDGKQNASMNSFSHYSFGAVCEWMFTTLAGIDTDGPGYGQIVIRPRPPSPGSNPEHKPIHWVKARTASHRGTIESAWRRDAKTFQLVVTVPPGSTATVHLPARSGLDVTEGGKPLMGVLEAHLLRHEDGEAVIRVGSGTYRFESRL
jgi:alpha-L-rhamnosidase